MKLVGECGDFICQAGGGPAETVGQCRKRLECVGRGASQVILLDLHDLSRPGFERGISEVSGVTGRSDAFISFQNNTEVWAEIHLVRV